MNKQEIINQIADMVMNDPDMRASMEALMSGVAEPEKAVVQRPDMMYVLTQKVKVHTDDESEVYHYHPVVGETLLIPGCVCNKMVSSGNLLELQQSLGAMCRCYHCEQDMFQILAMKPDEYDRLQKLLDETVTAIIENTQKAVDAFLKNGSYIGQNAISFESVYERIMTEMMSGARGTIGAALGSDSAIIDSIEGVEYDYPRCCPCDGCDCDDEDDEYDEEEDDEEDDEPPTIQSGVYIIRKLD